VQTEKKRCFLKRPRIADLENTHRTRSTRFRPVQSFCTTYWRFTMSKKSFVLGAALASAALFGCATMAQDRPFVDIGFRHGNLRNAQENIVNAFEYISQAQRDNDGQLGGHAARAKELLTEANYELRQAANVSNQEGR
jgi:hypothetical protein